GENSQWVVTDDQGNILGLPPTPEAVDFDGAGAGTCFIYHLSYEDGLTGLAAQSNLADLNGNFDLSNSIKVVRNAVTPPPGDDIIIEAEDFIATGGTFNDSFAGGPGLGVNQTAIGINFVNSGDYAEYIINVGTAGDYSITYEISTPSDNSQIQLIIDDIIVATDDVPNNGDWEDYTALVSSSTITNLGVGTHSVRILATGSNPWQWNLDRITLSLIGGNPSVDGGTISGGPFTFKVGDGIPDNVSGVTLDGNTGSNSQWIVTDDQRNILGLPPTPEAVDFDGAGEGTCFIYHISYEDGLTGLEANSNLSGLSGNFDLSNSIEVTRNATTPSPGNVTLIIEAEDFVSTSGKFNDSFAGGPGLGVNRTATNINFVNTSDWAEYSVNIPSDGEYAIEYLISTPSNGSQIQLLVDGTVVTTDNVPNNGEWYDYTSLIANNKVVLSAGLHTIRIVGSSRTIWQWNLDKIILSTESSTRDSGLDIDSAVQLSVYPNPASGNVFIQGLSKKLEQNAQIYDMKGAKYIDQTLANDHMINIENLPQGVYFLKIINSEENKNIRFIKN
ncbi:carbohydrate-binding protein, partial [Aquimarina sp. RZ0]|uniref:carbohydrate-binding protein n=1 Tax=Aquimarina sp. RZ0 TaxID=2607730 RepID=UPI0011F2488B